MKKGQAHVPDLFLSPGNDLLSQEASLQVSSALEVFTSVFGMGTGVSPPLWSPDRFVQVFVRTASAFGLQMCSLTSHSASCFRPLSP